MLHFVFSNKNPDTDNHEEALQSSPISHLLEYLPLSGQGSKEVGTL